MPLPRWLAHSNRHLLNRVTGPLARHLPGFGVVVHRGRRTGRSFRTPVNVFRRDDGYVIALTYGRESEWVRNVLAAGGCLLETGGRTVQLTMPRPFHDEGRRSMPGPVRLILGAVGVNDFLELRLADSPPNASTLTHLGTPANRRESGQAIVWIAAMMPVFISFVGLVIDAGVVFNAKRELQNLADGAARTGAIQLDVARYRETSGATVALDPAKARLAAAEEVAFRASSDWDWQIGADARAVVVKVSRPVRTAFIRIIGINTVPVGATALAQVRAGITDGR